MMRRHYVVDKYDPERNCLREINGVTVDESPGSVSYYGRVRLIVVLECGHEVIKMSGKKGNYIGPSLIQCKECQKDVLAAMLQLRRELDELHLAEIRARQVGTVGKIGEL